MTTRKHRAYVAFVFALCACGTTVAAQTRPALPIAYISLQKILAEAEDAKAAAKELEALRAERNRDLAAKRQALDSAKLQLANAGGMFSGARRQQLADQVKRQENELQQATQQAQTDFIELQKKIQDRLREEIGAIVKELANQRGVPYVLNQDAALVLAPSGANWTDEVLARLNTAAQKKTSEKPKSEATTPKK